MGNTLSRRTVRARVSLSRSLAFSLARSRSHSRSHSLCLAHSLSFSLFLSLSQISVHVYTPNKVLARVIIITKSQDLLSGHNTDENAFYVHVINSDFKEHRENIFLRMQVLGTVHRFSFTKPRQPPSPPPSPPPSSPQRSPTPKMLSGI